MPRKLTDPCPTKYLSGHFRGKHNIVGGYTATRAGVEVAYIPKRCVSCGAR